MIIYLFLFIYRMDSAIDELCQDSDCILWGNTSLANQCLGHGDFSFIDLTMYIQYVQEMINKKSKQSCSNHIQPAFKPRCRISCHPDGTSWLLIDTIEAPRSEGNFLYQCMVKLIWREWQGISSFGSSWSDYKFS